MARLLLHLLATLKPRNEREVQRVVPHEKGQNSMKSKETLSLSQ
jgi:hypothetical protein